MTFSYDLTGDVGKVRFHIGDVDPEAHMYEDEEIDAILTLYGSVNEASIACLNAMIARLAKPDFSADWLKVSLSEMRKGLMAVLQLKRSEFGLSGVSGRVAQTLRTDSDGEGV